ncbi:MAG: hypothetical protein QW693_06790 [Candidatus Bathyarchaeia archaeon]
MKFLKIKKSISSFLTQEEGGITKKALIGLGIALSGMAIQTAQARHSSSTNIWYDKPNVIARHSSHADHHSCSCQNVCKGYCPTQGCTPVSCNGVGTYSDDVLENCKELQDYPITS